MTLILLTTKNCVQCIAEKRWLKQRPSIDWKAVDVTKDDPESVEWRGWLEKHGYKQLPVTVVGGEHFGGYQISELQRRFPKDLHPRVG